MLTRREHGTRTIIGSSTLMFDFRSKLDQGLSYIAFLDRYATPQQRQRWDGVHSAVPLTPDQRILLAGFQRQMPIICLTGAWCGDCVNQCPIFNHFDQASPVLAVRYFDRDENHDLRDELKICGGARVPVVVFLSEDGEEVGRYGDRTLSRYRQIAKEQLGPSCPTGIVVPDGLMLAAVVQDWLNEFERAQLILRTSPRLRQIHGD
jgi:hypothetical protein